MYILESTNCRKNGNGVHHRRRVREARQLTRLPRLRNRSHDAWTSSSPFSFWHARMPSCISRRSPNTVCANLSLSLSITSHGFTTSVGLCACRVRSSPSAVGQMSRDAPVHEHIIVRRARLVKLVHFRGAHRTSGPQSIVAAHLDRCRILCECMYCTALRRRVRSNTLPSLLIYKPSQTAKSSPYSSLARG